MTLDEALAAMPVVAILRGVTPDEVIGVAEALVEHGITVIEVPMNSPQPVESIGRLARELGDRVICGAGTVLTVAEVEAVAAAGGQIIVSPNTDALVIRHSVERGLVPMPGFGTPSEAFTAYQAGARRLKLFPAVSYGPAYLRQLKAVLPKDASVLAVGGVKPESMGDWYAAGVEGFGLGGELYRPGQTPEETRTKAAAAAEAARRR
jgi:2-dehydro-3-deoxyphosphogalactonate aldolase